MPTRNFKVGEALNKRTPSTKTWINFDGSYTYEVYDSAVHYENEYGQLENINTDLFSDEEVVNHNEPVSSDMAGVVRELKRIKDKMTGNKSFQPLKVPFELKLPNNFKTGYSIGKGQDKLTFIPVGASTARGAVDENNKSVIQYADAWNDTDVTLEVQPSGVKETLIVKSDKAPKTFSFEVKGKDIDESMNAGVFQIEPAWLVDAKGERRDVALNVTSKDNKVYIELAPDLSGLVYPIEIDPTVSFIGDATNMVDIGYTVGSATPQSDTSNVLIGSNTSNAQWHYVSRFNFNVPLGSEILEAIFEIYHYNYYGSGGSAQYNTFLVTSDWDMATINGTDKMPSHDTNVAGVEREVYTGGGFGRKQFRIDNIAQAWSNGSPNYGLVMRGVSGAVNSAWYAYTANNTSVGRPPSVSITYNDPPTAPVVTAPNGGEVINSLHRISWNPSNDPITTTNDVFNPYYSIDVVHTTLGGQTFTATKTGKIKGFKMYHDYDMAEKIGTVRFGTRDPNTGRMGTVLGTGTVSSKDGDATLNATVDVVQGTMYAVEYEFPSNVMFKGYNDSNSGGNCYYLYNGSMTSNTGYDYGLTIYYQEGTNQVDLQYQIQLSGDNGATWKTITSLTAKGATYYDYDFINEPATSTALIRVRAYDGGSYSAWDTSDGVFTIQHNQAPNSPSQLSPSGIAVDRTKVIRMSWQHNDPDTNDPQSKFDLRWRVQGNTGWNVISVVTTDTFYDMPANTFPSGAIEWDVRTYDQSDINSVYSPNAVFTAAVPPASPTITAPSSTVSVSRPVIQWSSSEQAAYQIQVVDSVGTVVWDTGEVVSTVKSRTSGYDFQNNSSYTIKVRIKNHALWSEYVTLAVTVSYTPPDIPTITGITVPREGVLSIAYAAGTTSPTGTISIDLERRNSSEGGTWKRLANDLAPSGTYEDGTVTSGDTYLYRLIAHGDNGVSVMSTDYNGSLTITNTIIQNAYDPSERFVLGIVTARESDFNVDSATNSFAGRRSPVSEFGENEFVTISLDWEFDTHNEVKAFKRLIANRTPLLFRDGAGRKHWVSTDSVDVTDRNVNGFELSAEFEEISYTEDLNEREGEL